jgi:hypothetical protein
VLEIIPLRDIEMTNLFSKCLGLLAILLFSISAYAVDLNEVEKALTTTGVEG